jgi:hypothetical protein
MCHEGAVSLFVRYACESGLRVSLASMFTVESG